MHVLFPDAVPPAALQSPNKSTLFPQCCLVSTSHDATQHWVFHSRQTILDIQSEIGITSVTLAADRIDSNTNNHEGTNHEQG